MVEGGGTFADVCLASLEVGSVCAGVNGGVWFIGEARFEAAIDE